MAEFKTVNEKNVEFEVLPNDFELCQTDTKIHDQKFSSKPTTFFKDAMRRFRKNKSSVVGACIIGILVLLAIVVPVLSPHNVETPNMNTTYLTPKLFKAGTGFWDGTKTYSNIIYDTDNDTPVGFYKRSVVSITLREQVINQANQYAKGGYVAFFNDNTMEDDAKAPDFYEHRKEIMYSASDNVVVTFKFHTTNEEVKNGEAVGKPGEYRIRLYNTDGKEVILKDWSREYGEVSINVSDALKANNENYVQGKIQIQLKQEENYNTYLLIESITFDSSNKNTNERLNLIEITDPNKAVLMNRQEDGTFPDGYWPSTGVRSVYQAHITYCDFVYDVYDAKLGFQSIQIGKTTLDDYIKAGYCKFNYDLVNPKFEKLSDKCPIESIDSISYNVKDNIFTMDATVSMYKYIGYKSMPKFLLGTNESGFDLITQCFKGLRLSLVLSICASSVCILFGLCWGSISGYFGGNVDLFMERFCDILGGVPWIVVMTLAILFLGNNVATFAMALCLTGWMGTAARTRTQFYRFKGREYILASRTLGASDLRLIFKHILPNALGTIITSSVLLIPSTIFSESTLAYLNLGLEGSDGFGNILASHQQYLSTYPALIVFPAIIISLIMISFNLFGNGLRDAVNPSLKGSE